MSSYNRWDRPEDVIAQWKEQWAKLKGPVTFGGVALLLVLLASTSYYQVEPDELGVVLRFGKHIGNTPPGPHFKLPLGIDQVMKVPVERQLKMEFGFRTARGEGRSEYTQEGSAAQEAEMLTGDLNVGIVEWIVQFKVDNPERFLFGFRDVGTTLRLMSEAAMRAVVGDHAIDELITGGREAIEIEAKNKLIELNKLYDTGIVIQQLKLQDANAPSQVRPALREVEEAKQERERSINDAWAEYNKVIPRAKGSAEQSLQAAEGYAIERRNRATGDAERFRALYTEYKKDPEVTRSRLYLEAMAEILPLAKRKVLVDTKARSVLPLLNLDGGAK
jgi:modulator of FtsH protease HflK